MIKNMSKLVLLGLVLSLSVQAASLLKDMDGNERQLSDYTGKGKWTVGLIWASDCHVCNVEAEQYIQFHENNKNKNIQVVGISMDGQAKLEAAKSFIKRHDVTFPNLIGEFGDVAGMYEQMTGGEWSGTPTILVFDPAGELKAAQPGAVPVEFISQFINSQSASK